MRLFHFSDDPGITRFEPRPVRIPVDRSQGRDWLNGPLVWAIDDWHQPMYLFPRECPRILVWPTPGTTEQDRLHWMGDTSARMVAHIERSWLDRLRSGVIYRYELELAAFEGRDDAGMWVSRDPARAVDVARLDNLEREIRAQDVELRVFESLNPLREVWSSSLHASGIRLRNADGWGPPGWPHSRGA